MKDGQLLLFQLLLLLVPFWFLHVVCLVKPGGAGVAVPIKVILGIAVALVIEAVLLARRAMRKWDVVIGNIVEEVDLLFLQHQCGGDRVDWSITPALVEETTGVVEGVEVVDISLGAKPVQVANLEIGPL